ncbi:uncharacterized protein LOC125241868 [Leguminivora glycinivorella]|uniref:uncharacterized protein LOC125241868 n=1 Tax=Leguminivora glycinivorella TaxID=1035111 RepID=UPI00200D67AB|nr:uncharacterized protein LOC125241868 [Leguminivora glycinivorella]
MLNRSVLILLISIVLCSWMTQARRWSRETKELVDADLGIGLISSLKDDANLDLSVDEEYEDLRAELLAYQAALASVVSRRSLMTTPCWQSGGICVNYKLCKGAKSITQAAGCRDKHNVCCYTWNRYFVKDYRDKGIANIALPWITNPQVYGGKGIQEPKHSLLRKGKKKKHRNKKAMRSGIRPRAEQLYDTK